MKKCNYCNKEFSSIPFKCKYCKQLFCGEHRLPENHDCDEMRKHFSNKNYFIEKLSTKKENSKKKRKKIVMKPDKKSSKKTSKKIFNFSKLFKWIIILIFIFSLVYYFDDVSNKVNYISDDIFGFNNEFNNNYSHINKKPNISIQELELKIHDLINIERTNNRLSALSIDSNLVRIARIHSEDMAVNDFFDHINLDGEDPSDRAIKFNYFCRKDYGSYYTEGVGENLFQVPLYESCTYYENNPSECVYFNWYSLEKIAEIVVQGWMKSPGHRENILTADYDKEGVGAYIHRDYIYITQKFC